MRITHLHALAATGTLAALLAGCGGGTGRPVSSSSQSPVATAPAPGALASQPGTGEAPPTLGASSPATTAASNLPQGLSLRQGAADPAKWPGGYTVSQVRHAYGLDQIKNQGEGQTIAIFEPYTSPTLQNDLATFSKAAKLPPAQLTLAGEVSPRMTPAVWAAQTTLDCEWAHALAPNARLVVFAQGDASYAGASSFRPSTFATPPQPDVGSPNQVAICSQMPEFQIGNSSAILPGDCVFNCPEVSFFAPAGRVLGWESFLNSGKSWPSFPADRPYVCAVGGTSLNLAADGSVLAETGWSQGGGAISEYFGIPDFQEQSTAVAPICRSRRAAIDVACVADPSNGFQVYTTTPYQGKTGWMSLRGTDASVAQWAAISAVVNSARVASGRRPMSNLNKRLYALGSSCWRDITAGGDSWSQAATGFDLMSGLGSPTAATINALITSTVGDPPVPVSTALPGTQTASSWSIATLAGTRYAAYADTTGQVCVTRMLNVRGASNGGGGTWQLGLKTDDAVAITARQGFLVVVAKRAGSTELCTCSINPTGQASAWTALPYPSKTGPTLVDDQMYADTCYTGYADGLDTWALRLAVDGTTGKIKPVTRWTLKQACAPCSDPRYMPPYSANERPGLAPMCWMSENDVYPGTPRIHLWAHGTGQQAALIREYHTLGMFSCGGRPSAAPSVAVTGPVSVASTPDKSPPYWGTHFSYGMSMTSNIDVATFWTAYQDAADHKVYLRKGLNGGSSTALVTTSSDVPPTVTLSNGTLLVTTVSKGTPMVHALTPW